MAPESPRGTVNAALEELFEHADRVRFIHWEEFSGARTTVLLIASLAVLSFIAGLSALSQETLQVTGPFAIFIPDPETLVRLYGVLFAFLLGGLTFGLHRRIRVAWYGAMVAIPLLAGLPLITASATDVPLLAMALVTYPMLVRNRDVFDRSMDLSPFQLAALGAFFGAQVYGTIGAFVLREEYIGIETPTDAFYYIIVTGTTVGYGDATPDTQLTKLFTLSVIVLTTGAFTVATGSLLIPAIESRISSAFGNMTASELRLLEDHIIVLGHDELTEPLLDELRESADVVVVTPDTDAVSALRDEDVNVLTADPTDKESLVDAGIRRAAGVVVATAEDAQNVLGVLAARQVNPDIRIVAAAHDRIHVEKLEDVGANEVISPTIIGGQILGQSVLAINEDETADEPEETRDGTDESVDT